jgi:hypothetical protein
MRRKVVVWVSVLTVFAVGAILVMIRLWPAHTVTPAPPHTAATAAADQGPAVAAALKRLAIAPQDLVATGATALVGDRAGQAVPTGSTVAPDERSWSPDGIGGGTMLVTITPPGGTATTYAAVMVREPGGWKVLATFPISAGG